MPHEPSSRPETLTPPSERSFGRVFAGVGAILAAFFAWRGAMAVAGAFAAAAVALLALAQLAPGVLATPNRLWFRFGMLLHRFVQPVVLGVMFFGVVAPIGLLMRATGTDPLRLKRKPDATSYWVEREDPVPSPQGFRNQF